MPKGTTTNQARNHPTLALKGNPGVQKHKVQITTWNIQKINPTKCLDHGTSIKAHLRKTTKLTLPFLIAILENKKEPKDVEKLLREFPDKTPTQEKLETGHIPMGGSTYTQENLVWVAGGGLKVIKAEEWTAWHGTFNSKVDTETNSLRDRYKAALPGPNPESRSVRTETRNASREQFDAMKHPHADHFRNPILLTLEQESTPEQLTVLIVHAPGPGGKELALPTYATSYMDAVFDAAFNAGIRLVQGDMNFHGEKEFPGYRRLGANEGPTTLTKSGEGGSHMDRVYVLSPHPDAHMSVNQQDINLDVSDHFSMQTILPIVARPAVLGDAQMTDASDSSKDETMCDAPLADQAN